METYKENNCGKLEKAIKLYNYFRLSSDAFVSEYVNIDNFFSDLNYVRKIEDKMTYEQLIQVHELLYCEIVPPDQFTWRATAEQRTEAIGRVLKLW